MLTSGAYEEEVHARLLPLSLGPLLAPSSHLHHALFLPPDVPWQVHASF